MPEKYEPRTRPEMPSATGLFVFAQREGMWASTAEALHVGGQTSTEAVRTLLQTYHMKHLGQDLATAIDLVGKLPEVALHAYVVAFEHKAKTDLAQQSPSAPVTAAGVPPAILKMWEALMGHHPARVGVLRTDGYQVTLDQRPILRIDQGMLSASWGGKVSLATASVLNAFATLAGLHRPFRAGLDDGALYRDQPCDAHGWVELGPGPAHVPQMATASSDFAAQELGCPPLKTGAAKTAVSYPQSVVDKGGDPGKVRQALEKAVKALNEAATSALKFDDRLLKLERDVYGLFKEYLAYDQQAEQLKAREDAAKEAGRPVTSSLSTPPTDERAGEHDDGDLGSGDSITAAADPKPSDEEILTAARTLSLAQARAAYINGTMTQDLFDAFVPLWQALHQKNGPELLQGSLDRGDIDQHQFDLGQQLLAGSET